MKETSSDHLLTGLSRTVSPGVPVQGSLLGADSQLYVLVRPFCKTHLLGIVFFGTYFGKC